ncbi:MAG: hypothetical protein OEO77_07960, partial [Acidimicrobiia bacterium]|nr:hypothetical protein [Acidimicrobiia bacterium]
MLKGKWTPWRPLVVVLCSFTMVTATVPAVPLLSGPATALSTHVVPHTYPTIQAAIDARVALITIAPGTYKENLTLPNNADVTLRGDDPSTTTIDGDLKGAVIDKGRAKALVVENLTITRGARASGAGIGGGIHSSDNALTLRNVIVTANSENAGAGVVIDKGTLAIENSVISSNTAKNNGGGVLVRAGTATITNTSFLNNRAEAPETGAGEGGALVVLAGTVTITDSTFDGNMAIRDGGAIWNDGILNVTGSTITNNATQRDGGGIYDVGVGFTITDSTVAGNTATGKGGGIYENTGSSSPASIYTRVTISGNTAGTGAGAYFANSSGSVVITESTISGNTATVDGGGGLYNSTGLTLARSTLSGNTSNTRGGGFYNIAGTVSATNSTISGNSATASGGGIFESSNNGTTLNNVTVTANTAPVGSGITVSAGKLTMANTVVAGNTGSPNNVNGTFTGTPNLTTGDPILGPLGDNGGPTLTHLPLSGSPAINAGTNATCATIDQRNVARPQGVACDLGAVEAGLADLSITMADSPDPVDAGGDLTYTLTITNNGPSPSSGSTVTDTLPAELANQQVCVVTGTVDCSNATDFVAYTGTVAVGPLASGVSASMYLRGTVDPGLDDLTLTNTATVAGAELDQAPGNNSATAETSVLAAVTTVDVTDISADLPAVGAFPSKLDIPTLKSSPEALDALRQATATSNPTDDTVEGSQISAIQISAIQISAIQISAIQISAIQISAIQISAIQISAIQISAIGSCSGVTADTDGDGTLDGEELLALTNAYGDAPTQTVTLGQLFALVESSGESDCVKDAIRALTLENIGLGSSEIGSLSLVSLAIGGLQISAIHPDPTATEAEKLADWCSALAAQGYDCATAGVTATTNLMSLDLAGVQISAIELDGTLISAIQISAIQISAIDLNGIQISAIQISAIDPVVVTDLINCNLVSCQTATLGDAWLAEAFWDDVTLGDLLQALIPSDELPWEQLPVDQVPVPVLLAASESAQTVGYTASFDVDTPGDNPKPASAVVTLEDGFRYVPGTAALGATAAEPTTDGQTLSFDLGDIPTGTYQLTFDAVPGLTLGTFGATVGVTVAEASDSLRGAPVTVLQNFEPGNNASAAVFGFDDDTLLFGHAPPSDNDFWSFSPSLVLPGADGHYTVRLAQLGVDADLLVYGPKTDPLSPFDTRGNSLQIEPLEDRGLAIGDQTDDLDPAALEDIVLSSDLLNGPWELEGLSVSRSTQDESVEFFTADPANDPLTIQVASVNHTSSATADEVSNSTYTLWVKTEFAAPVSCPVPAPTGGTPGAVYPAGMTAQDLAQLDTVFLVNRSRIERHESAADADAVMAKLADLVDALNGGDPELGALGLHAAVIAVEGDLTAAGITSTTGAAISNLYAAWDADPCDYTLANDVAFEITNIVKDLDDTNPLQFVTVVGSDSEIPMFRQRDWAKVSNEKLYKSTFAGNTALFGSSASERFLTDDGYGDRDPLPLEQQSGVLFQPDMSLGRLVETSDEIIGLIDEYL